MSERAAAAGNSGPPHTITHGDRTYTILPVVSEGVMLQVEAEQYARAKRALYEQREMMPEGAYLDRLDGLRKLYEAGHYAFESDHTMAFLRTKKGTLTLLTAMMDCTAAEIVVLLNERGPELQDILRTVLQMSMPKEDPNGPKRGGRRR